MATVAHAQWQASADVGAAHLQRTNIPQSGAATFAANVTGVGDRAWVRSSLLGVVAGANQITIQALMAGSIAASPEQKVRGELSGFLSAFAETGGDGAVSGGLMPRLQFGSAGSGGAVGLGLGAISDAESFHPLYQAAADAWYLVNDDQFAATLSTVRTQYSFSGTTTAVNVSRSFTDLSGGWRRDLGGLVLGANAGYRYATANAGSGAWGSLDAALWVFPRSAIVLSGGRTLEDPVRGIPRTTFASVALRVTGQSHPTIGRRPTLPGARITIRRLDEAIRRIEVRGVSGTHVEVMGDFTDWNPISLESMRDGWWLERAITPGLHRIALRIDGAEWIAPANLPRSTDDLGGVVGLITVP